MYSYHEFRDNMLTCQKVSNPLVFISTILDMLQGQSYQGRRIKGWLTADGHYHLRLAYPGIQGECYWYIIWWD